MRRVSSFSFIFSLLFCRPSLSLPFLSLSIFSLSLYVPQLFSRSSTYVCDDVNNVRLPSRLGSRRKQEGRQRYQQGGRVTGPKGHRSSSSEGRGREKRERERERRTQRGLFVMSVKGQMRGENENLCEK